MNRLECLIIGLFIPLLVCASAKNDIHNREIAYLQDFAEIYGTVRWFMPSDEARNMDWDALCLYGADKILECRTDEEFYSTLESIYSGIIPMFEIDKGEKSAQMDSYYAGSHDAMKPVYWQHAGVELSIFSNKYSSKRVNRENDSYSLNRFAVLGYLPIMPKNDTLRVVFRVKSVPVDESYLSYYGIVLDTYNTADPIDYLTQLAQNEKKVFKAGTGWKEISYSVGIDTDSYENLFWGLYLIGEGECVIDYMRIEDCEGNRIASVDFGNLSAQENSFHILNEITHKYGEASDGLHVSLKNKLYEDKGIRPYCSIRLSGGQYAHIPMLLWSDDSHTYPMCGYYSPALWSEKDIVALRQDETVSEIADIITAWNVIKYFSPYLQGQNIDWNSKLRLAFRKALVSYSSKYEALRQLMSEINDAHISYMNFSDNYQYFFPARIKLVNKKAVVVEPYVPELQKGDILLSLNGNRSMNIVKYFTSLRSGSRHSKVPEAEAYAFNAQDSVAGCRIKRAGRKLDMNVRMIVAESYYYRLYTSYENLLNRNKSRYINDNILYLNPGISGLDEIKMMLEQHAQGSPVIIDLRFSSTFLIRYIMPLLWNGVEFYEKRPVTFIPEVSFLNTNNEIPDLGRKHRKSRKDCNTNIVFLINSSVISNQEEFLDYIKYNGMACLVGENTAGICGNINVIPLPSNKMVVFTGERYYSVAGMSGDYFKKGVDPDIRVIQTKKNIFNDNDLFLQKAVSFFVND